MTQEHPLKSLATAMHASFRFSLFDGGETITVTLANGQSERLTAEWGDPTDAAQLAYDWLSSQEFGEDDPRVQHEDVTVGGY